MLNIHLEDDHLLMTPAGCILRGIVELNLDQPTKLRNITLRLTGHIRKQQTIPLGNGLNHYEHQVQNILQKSVSLLPNDKPIHTLPAKSYIRDFCFVVPPDVPESTRVGNDTYVVRYQIEAVAERPTVFLRNYNCKRTIHISREPESGAGGNGMIEDGVPQEEASHLDYEPFTLADQWHNRLDYMFTIPVRAVRQGEQIVLSGHMAALTPQVDIMHLSCQLVEYSVCRTIRDGRTNKPRNHSRVVQETGLLRRGFDQISLPITVPASPEKCQADCFNQNVKIRHRLKIFLHVMDPDYDDRVTEIRLSMPIKICPSFRPATHKGNDIPSYEDCTASMPYDPLLMAELLRHPPQSDLPSYAHVIAAATGPSCAIQAQHFTTGNALPNYDDIVPRQCL
ncbi:hypothetical protein O0I10_001679 [Lichtheimia ornata]|uniref:Arrestin C-terminal-like domain-containing protein n=1 Tax=Lichtheimia ornata TaxID=688661 RepID=A0AAD7VCR3_9FUNG|nr:uncharacterized protein O0I10_001679 [Lichtheimia ornata]KAJ8662715.1 hypothetical protein O0I10_001679 [Lichtheimia ornata]